MYTLSDGVPGAMTLSDFPAAAGNVVAGAFDDALETNPVPMFMLARELNQMRAVGPKLSRDSAMEEAKRRGVDVKVPEDGISALALGMLIERRQDQAARDLLFSRREGFVAGAGVFGAGLAGALMDPLNAASGFIPVLSGTRYAGTLAKAATQAGRAGTRLAVGAAEGAIGAAAVELPTLQLRRELQDDYTLYDSLANVAFGTFANAGIRGVSGALRDRWRGIQAARQEDFLRSVEPAEWEAQRRAYQAQVERDMDTELRGGFDRGEGASDGLAARWAEERETARNRLPQTDDDIGPHTFEMLPKQARTRVGAEALFKSELEKGDFVFFHEAPGDVRESVMKKGLVSKEMQDSTFATLGEPSEFITGGETKTVVRFKVPKNQLHNVVPDMPYGAFEKLSNHQNLLLTHKGVKGADVGINRTIPKGWILSADVMPVHPSQLVNDETHALALKTAVAQAAEGRRIDVDPVLRQDPVFGAQRMSAEEVRKRALSNMSPEQKVASDPEASARANATIEAEAPAAVRAEPPPPRGPGAAGAEAPKSPEMVELEERLAAARKEFEAAAKEAGVEVPKPSPDDQVAMKRAQDYEKAWQAVANCVKGKGV